MVFHSQTGGTARMAERVVRGASDPDVSDIDVRCLRATAAGPRDVLGADAIVLGTPENFGYMSGGLKDFFDRTFYPLQGRVEGLPCAIFVKGGNDGTGALSSVRRIIKGYPFREVQPPIVCGGDLDEMVLQRCEELGAMMAAGLELGMY